MASQSLEMGPKPGSPLPEIIWAASRPPAPPFDGMTLKSYSGISALASLAPIHLITYSETGQADATRRQIQEYWGASIRSVRILEYGPASSVAQAIGRRRFLFTSRIDRPDLHQALDDLQWTRRDRLIFFDDIAFAPFAERYGENAILSPHDCISDMARGHFLSSRDPAQAARFWLQYRFALGYERTFYHHALLVHLVTTREQSLVENINSGARTHVVPNSFLPGPLTAPSPRFDWDVLIWTDLDLPTSLTGTRLFLDALRTGPPWDPAARIALVGRVPAERATGLLGPERMRQVEYSSRLEDADGRIRQGRITVVADLGKAGIKNRCLNVLAAGKCLACLYTQMGGLEPICDVGAINALTMHELVDKIRRVCVGGTQASIASIGGGLFQRLYEPSRMTDLWSGLIRRAVAIREGR